MRTASFGVYPSLGRTFKTIESLAEAGCMSPRRAHDCVRGLKDFTDQEKKAIANEIIARMVMKEIDSRDMFDMIEARTDFDKIFRSEE